MGIKLKSGAIAASTLISVGLLATPAMADVSPLNGDSETVTAAPMTTYQTNGTVWTMEIVNNVLYVGGNFTAVRPSGAAPGTNEIPRSRLAAFDATTGALLPWAPIAKSAPFTPVGTPDKNCWAVGGGQHECSTVWSIKATPDKSKIVVGGDFQTLDGKVRAGLAAFNTSNGALDTTFKPSVSGRIYSVFPTENGVYIGGGVSRAGGQIRGGLAAFDFPSGALRPWAPVITKGTSVATGFAGIKSIVVTDDRSRVIVGGGFDKMNGENIHGVAAVDATTGANAPWADKKVTNVTAITSLLLKNGVLYTTGDALGMTAEGVIAFNPNTGQELWYDSCRGASHSVEEINGVVYAGSHAHDCGAMTDGFPEQYNGHGAGDRRRYKLRAEVPNGAGGARLLHWTPDTNDGNGPRAMATDGTRLWIGGEFTYVDGQPQQGLTRFAFLGDGPNDGKSRKPITPNKPIVHTNEAGKVEIIWQATEDPDNRDLEYWVIRDHVTKFPIAKVNSSDKPWLKGWMSYTDTDVAPGESRRYDIRAVDPTGAQSVRSPGVTVTVAATDAPKTALPVSEGATAYYTFDQKSGSNFVDAVSGRIGTSGSKATQTTAIIPTQKALSVDGTSGAVVVEAGNRAWTPRQTTFEMTFKTDTNRGGALMGLSDSTSTTGFGTAQQILYMGNDGKLRFGIRPNADRTNPWANPSGSMKVLATADSYNDNNWHHVAVTFEPGTGTKIYVDGAMVANDVSMNWTMPRNAYLRIGADQTSGWASAPTSSWFTGAIDDAAFYRYPLTASQIARHSAAFLSASP